jgi:hypothetical protein
MTHLLTFHRSVVREMNEDADDPCLWAHLVRGDERRAYEIYPGVTFAGWQARTEVNGVERGGIHVKRENVLAKKTAWLAEIKQLRSAGWRDVKALEDQG